MADLTPSERAEVAKAWDELRQSLHLAITTRGVDWALAYLKGASRSIETVARGAAPAPDPSSVRRPQ